MTEMGSNITKNDRQILKKCDEKLEKIENLFIKSVKEVSKLRESIKSMFSPDEKRWKSWTADELFRYYETNCVRFKVSVKLWTSFTVLFYYRFFTNSWIACRKCPCFEAKIRKSFENS